MLENTIMPGQKGPEYTLSREEEEQIIMQSDGNISDAVKFAFQYGCFKSQANRRLKDTPSSRQYK